MRKTKKNKLRFFEIIDEFVMEETKYFCMFDDDAWNILKLYTDIPEERHKKFIPEIKPEMKEEFYIWKIDKLTEDYNRLLEAVYEITDKF